MSTLLDVLDELTVEGELYETLPDDSVRCFACGHRCLIRDGRRGICKVRYNQGGKLRVPWGYVAALQSDPIEKKPFFHFLPGSDALTFGMLGCDLHCSYCFPGETMVITNRGPITLAEAFESTSQAKKQLDADIAFPQGLQAVTANGDFKTVRAVFRHPYLGKLIRLKPYYLPELRCTPDHKIYATLDPQLEPQPIPASQLTMDHFLAIPRQHGFGQQDEINVEEELGCLTTTYGVVWDLSLADRQLVSANSIQGQTSRQIGQIRFPNEHKPGIPKKLALDENLARLLGLYCAEGSVVQSKSRPNSLALNFSYSHQEAHLALETVQLLKVTLGVTKGHIFQHPTTLGVTASKASAALLFKMLAGERSQEKRVPQAILDAPESVIQAFLNAYVEGDGHIFENGKVSVTTVSRKLAYGVAWLVLKLGYLPSVYDTKMPEEGKIQDRRVKRAPSQFTVVWYQNPAVNRKAIVTKAHYLVPLRSIGEVGYEGSVYNLEVEEIHNYLAGFTLVSNCQNWVTSQAGRDEQCEIALGTVHKASPEQLVQVAKRAGAGVVVSSYNEPLITTEWAVDVFRQAKQAGLQCAYVSNGNMTPEVIKYLRPYIVGYKIDLKSMQDKHYRQLGGVLANILEGIRLAHELGLWVEVVTLVVPGFNDSNEELMDAAHYIASISKDIPWHVTAFHPDYQMDSTGATPVSTLIRAAEIGQEAGLHFVYAGNIHGRVNEYENTYCPHCQAVLIERTGFTLLSYHITKEGKCPKCGTSVPGLWTDRPENVRLGGWGMPKVVRF